jgi:hypothetical protein
MLVAVALTMFCLPLSSPVLAKSAQPPQAGASPDIDPAAIDALNKLGVYLRSLKAFQVEADINNDDVLDDGMVVQSSKKVDMIAVRPNKLRVEITGEDENRLLFFDGKNFSIYGKLVNLYATVPAPPTIAELISDLQTKYGMELPLVDLFQWGTNDTDLKRIKIAVDVGPSSIDGVSCEQYVFHQEQVDWQIWIQLGDFPLPRKLVIRTLTDEARPQHSERLTWNLAPSYSEDAFTFDPPPGANRITIAEAKANSTGSKK